VGLLSKKGLGCYRDQLALVVVAVLILNYIECMAVVGAGLLLKMMGW
jgi:hypothetical protein